MTEFGKDHRLRIYFGTRLFEAQGLFFDKDGTLVDLHHQYSTLMDKRVEKILDHHPGKKEEVRSALCRAVGYDPHSRTIAPSGPLAVATREQTLKIVIHFLSQQGFPLGEGEKIARESFRLADLELGLDELIRPMNGLYSLLQALNGGKIFLACLTNDEHRRAQSILEFLKISVFFHLVLGGDEVNRPKPDPEMIETACKRLMLLPEQIVYIGDTAADMIMAKRAGAGLAVGVLGGAANESLLSAEADIVIPNLEAISIPDNREFIN
ncbi:MAG: HAD family hydrolase [Thermodesulfobacteriota bacterium]|jgi:HAD superfamily hydrolase (TIGR01549 family)